MRRNLIPLSDCFMPHTNGVEFLEPLPESCPPIDVTPPSEPTLWRLLKSDAPSAIDFVSQRERLPTRPYDDECLARSISLVTSLAVCRAVIKSPRMKFSHAVPIAYDPSLGIWHKDSETHVNWWPYKTTDPVSLIGNVENLNG